MYVSEPSPLHLWAQGSNKGSSTQHFRPNLHPIYQQTVRKNVMTPYLQGQGFREGCRQWIARPGREISQELQLLALANLAKPRNVAGRSSRELVSCVYLAHSIKQPSRRSCSWFMPSFLASTCAIFALAVKQPSCRATSQGVYDRREMQ